MIALFCLASTATAETFELTTATIADINKAFDEGALNSEQLVELSLTRIAAYDEAGPKLNAVMLLNPDALDTARALDAERREKGRRSPLHGIPVVLKDNIDTADMPTTAGSFMLKGSVPPDDAFLVRQLREAGAVILAKLNMSEFASHRLVRRAERGRPSPQLTRRWDSVPTPAAPFADLRPRTASWASNRRSVC
jgi:amidase